MLDLPIYISAPAITIAFVALTNGGGLLDFWPTLVHKVSMNPKFTAIMYECPKCISGQIALWWSVCVGVSIEQTFFNIIYSIAITYTWEKI